MMIKKNLNRIMNIVISVITIILILALNYRPHISSNIEDETVVDTTYSGIEEAYTSISVSDEMIYRKGYTVSYNSDYRIPNWVAWELERSEIGGNYGRPNIDFRVDPKVKNSACHKDYTRSGYDRGHMFPAGDAHWDYDVMQESFYLSNICPQVPNLNRGVWERLEEHCRYLAQFGNLYICCGPLFGESHKRIGENKVLVPDGFFKVLCMKRDGKWIGIGFIFPNDDYLCKSMNMAKQTLRIREIEDMTGHEFFIGLPDSVKSVIKDQDNFKDWQ